MTITAWFMDCDSTADQREPHKATGDSSVPGHILDSLGVLRWEGIAGVDCPRLAVIKSERGYSYTDLVTIHPEKLPNYEDKMKMFFREHIHYDEEIRFCVDGSGYFDVRDKENRWIRIAIEKGDLIILPEGIYHRFTCDSNNYIQALRLFVGEPIWTPYNRDEIDEMKNESRQKYVTRFLS